ncbi:MAG TPA: dTDP-4-dehydrorhamnose 3,5-epimerase [Solirubrobacterales bacterium]|nr:dTDP-4-dehydrorhamnose 3,5-epimerase [Solirubrobacterales bacterium]
MRFDRTPVDGAWVIELERRSDERGWFARTFSREEFEAHGLDPSVVHANTSFNPRAGTLRGMHYQADPHAETKLVRCTRGAIYDVIVDLRRDSHTFKEWFAIELRPDNDLMLYVPRGVAHGFQTLDDATEVSYLMSHQYAASHARGVRWDDPTFGIEWPRAERTISERDRGFPDFE